MQISILNLPQYFYIPPAILPLHLIPQSFQEVYDLVSVNVRRIEELKQTLDSAANQLNLSASHEKAGKQHEAVLSELGSIENLVLLNERVESLLPEFNEDLLQMLNTIREERKKVREEFRAEYEKTEKRRMKALDIARKVEKARKD
jgi:hypothetical protein